MIPVGSLVEVVEDRTPMWWHYIGKDAAENNRHYQLVRREGVVLAIDPWHGVSYDVELAEPLPDGRQCLWFSEWELVVL